ncbi:hypothetical protein RFI_10797, partial [Reticulomyxa filosa]
MSTDFQYIFVKYCTGVFLTKKKGDKNQSINKIMLMFVPEENKCKTISLEECYNKEWVTFLDEQLLLKNFQCLLCKEVANNAMELICNDHEDQKDALVVGGQCLMRYLNEHNGECPVGNHGLCNYVRGKAVRNFVDELVVICPRQFMSQETEKANVEMEEGTKITRGGPKVKHGCTFKGKIKEMKNHLERSCQLKPSECKFKEFGCKDLLFEFNAEQHLQSQMKRHMDLLLAYINVLQQNEMVNFGNLVFFFCFFFL